MQKNRLLFCAVLIVIAVLIGYFVITKKGTDTVLITSPKDTACTQEAKICPDGSSVARVAPSCEFAACPAPKEQGTTSTPPAKTPQTLCIDDGGSWERAGALGTYRCMHSYSDAGKACTASSQCQGGCIVTNQNSTAAMCKRDDNPFGCYQSIEEKNAGRPVLCRD